jgi:hypothetical protein
MSEQMDMFNSNESLSLLAELSILRPKLQKNQREMKWLRNPEITSAGNDCAFIVPSCFNDALDIKKTLRIKNKKGDEKSGEKQKIWTQGSTFYFKSGDIFYSKKTAYTDWPKAISDGLYVIQVVSGKASVPGKNGKNERDRDKGEVIYTVYYGCKKENILQKDGVYTTIENRT